MPTEVKAGFDVITVNHGQTFMVTGPEGVARGSEQQGLFAHDVRFLSHYRCRISGRRWKLVTSAPVSHTSARFVYTNPALLSASGAIPKHVLGLTIERTVSRGVHEDFDLVNYGRVPVELFVRQPRQSPWSLRSGDRRCPSISAFGF